MKLIGFSSPNCAKFCPPEFNIRNGCNTIRFGTLFDFRTEENEKLRDEGEGTFSYSVEFPELTKVSHEWIGAFEVEDNGSFHIGEMEIRNGDFFVKNMILTGSSHNCWVYCISKSTEVAGNITDTHQDKWLISQDKLQLFANYLGGLLWSEVNLSDLPDHITSKFSMQEILQRLSLSVEVKEIDYNHRSVTISREEDLPASQISALKDSIAFIKPKMFEKESEIRIAFWLIFDNKKISIQNKPKIVGLRPIDKII